MHILLPKEPPKEENERHASKNVVPRHNISIRDVISGKSNLPEEPVKIADSEAEILNEDDVPQGIEQDFDQDKLDLKWALFAESIQAEKPRMSIALRSRQPVLKPEFLVEVILENSTLQEDFMANVKAHMQSFLRKELFNDSIRVTVKLDDIIDDGKRKMYTTEEKFQFLMNKNPAVARLKQQFNLELE